MKSILFIVPYPPQGASNRFRVLQFLPVLERNGINTRVRPFYNHGLWSILYRKGRYISKLFHGLACSANRLLDLWRSIAYDMVFIHRESFPLGPAWFERCLRLMGKPYIYDFDDAVFLPNTAAPNRWLAGLKCPEKTSSVVRLSRLTIAGNRYLADYAAKSGAGKVEVLPTVVDTDKFQPLQSEKESGVIVVGWIGSTTTIEFLEPFIGSIWAKVIRRVPEARLRIVGGQPRQPWPEGVECVPWILENEVEQLQQFDVGIMPMPDNPWTRGKCAFKAIEYMAAGVPAVCSPVGMNLELIKHGETGFLPRDENQWVDILVSLASNPELRRKIGVNGRELIEKCYSLRAVEQRFLELIRESAGEISIQ